MKLRNVLSVKLSLCYPIFIRTEQKNDGYRPSCKGCTNQYYYDNRNRIFNNNKYYMKENRSKRNAYERQNRKNDCNFNLFIK